MNDGNGRPRIAVSAVFTALAMTLVVGGFSFAQAQAGADQTYGEPVEVEGGEYRNIAPIELRAMMESDDVPVVNVHIPFAGNIPGTDESIPFNEITDNLDRLPEDRDAAVVLYCRSGPMSQRAAAELVGLGYTNVYNLEGGMVAWTSAGMQLEGQ